MHRITVLRYPISAFNCEEAQRFRERERERERDGGRERGLQICEQKGDGGWANWRLYPEQICDKTCRVSGAGRCKRSWGG